MGRKLTVEGSGGAAEASIAAGAGVPTLDGFGFGIVGSKLYTPEEYFELDSVAPRICLLTRMLRELSKGQ